MDLKNLEDRLFSPIGRWVLGGIAALIVALLIFHAGMVVGYNRAFQFHGAPREFSVRMGGPVGWGPSFSVPTSFIPEGHGIVGTISESGYPTFTITAPDGDDVPVVLATTTLIRGPQGDASTSALVPQRQIIILGDPDDAGRVDASFIRIIK
ncbi:MAG TPA: hypothetical protein VG753_00510 [Candidatus Paceibacterota bacterium]|nr:hypothetical protein [Candidatus Paceibacterota bacterium]